MAQPRSSSRLTGRTPLFLTMIGNHVGFAKYLLEHGANPNIANNNGLSPLHQATLSGTCETVKLLLAKGAYIDPVAFLGIPLHCTATKGRDDIMKILLDHKADCNKLVYGMTPLIVAIDAASSNCMVLLIKAGANLMGALTYSMENPLSAKLVSTVFVNCIMEGVAANQFVPDDDEPESKREIKAAGFKKLAGHDFKEGNYHSAEKLYTVAIRFDPNNATLYSNRSLCWLRIGEGDKVLLDANECRKLRPDWLKACYRQGAALMLLKDYKGARECFLHVLELDPANTVVEDALLKAYWKMCQSTKAE